MKQYLESLNNVMKNGKNVTDPSGSQFKTIFGQEIRFDLSEGFPAITTRGLGWEEVVSNLMADMSEENIRNIKTVIEKIKNTPEESRITLKPFCEDVIGDVTQFRVINGKLYCQTYQCSVDMFLDVPNSVAKHGLLTHIISQICNLNVGELIWVGGDCHIKNENKLPIYRQLSRPVLQIPKLKIPPFTTLEEFTKTDSVDYFLDGYQHQGIITVNN